MKSNFHKMKAVMLTLMVVLLTVGFTYAQVKTLEETIKNQSEIDLHGPALDVPWAPEGSGRAIGDDCVTPIIIGSFPYTDVNTTVGRVNNYDLTCMGSYDGGEDIIYQFTITAAQLVTASLNPGTTAWTGIAIMDACPMTGTCVALSTNSAATTHSAIANLAAGTYYLMIDTYPAPANITSFTLNVTLAPPLPNFPAYGFMKTNNTYSEITGGIAVGTETADDQFYVDPAVPAGSSTVSGPGFAIGFPFVFNTQTFDRLGVNNNGWIGLGISTLTPSVNLQSSSAYTPLSSSSTAVPTALRSRIAGFARDFQAQPGSSIRIETIGTAPNRVCVVQFKDYKRYGTAFTGVDFINMQIRLYETTNEVKIVYGNFTTTSTAAITGQVGLGGDVAGNYLNRTSTTSWDVTNAGTANTATMTFSDVVFPENVAVRGGQCYVDRAT